MIDKSYSGLKAALQFVLNFDYITILSPSFAKQVTLSPAVAVTTISSLAMPLMQIFTNLTRTQVPDNFGHLAAQILHQTLKNKPIERIVVHVATDQLIFTGSSGGNTAPNAYAIVRSIGSVSLEDNRKTIAEMTKLVSEKLLVPSDEFRMFFFDHKTDTIGFNGQIVADQLTGKV